MNFDKAWERIRSATDVQTFGQLGEIVGKTQSNVSVRKRKGDFPIEWAYLVAEKYNLSTKWILTGKGTRSSNQTEVNTVEYEFILLLNEWATEFLEENSKNQIWFERQIERALPEFERWMRSREAEKENRKVA